MNVLPTRLTDATLGDLRYALRVFRRRPLSAAVVLLTLALAIGASASVFGVVRAVLLRPLPYHQPDRLALLWNRSQAGSEKLRIALPDVAEFRERSRAFEGFAATDHIPDAVLGGDDGPRHIRLGHVTRNFFSLLGVEPTLGRSFLPEEGLLPPEVLEADDPEISPGPVILSHGLWTRSFGGDPDVLGRSVTIDGSEAVVVGVAPQDFELLLPPDVDLPGRADVWAPFRIPLEHSARPRLLRDQDSDNTGVVIGRLAPGHTLADAREEMAVIAAELRARHAYHARAGLAIRVEAMRSDVTGSARPVLLALMAAVGGFLLIACLNIANLLAARAVIRSPELALRAALGADRGRLTRQLLAEGSLLAGLGALGGIGIAVWGTAFLRAAPIPGLPRLEHATVDLPVLLFAGLATILTGLIIGVVPALAPSVMDRGASPAGGGRGGAGPPNRRIRDGLVVGQVALAVVLVASMLLVARGVSGLRNVDPGFDPAGVLTFRLSLRGNPEYAGPGERAEFVRRAEERIAALPGVTEVGVVGRLPLDGRPWTTPWGPAGSPPEEWSGNEANFRTVTPGFFRAMGTRLLAGRTFTAEENRSEDRRVAVVGEKLAARLAARGSAVGARLGVPVDGRPLEVEVVGVAEHVRYSTLERDDREAVYVPYRHEASRDIAFVIRTVGSPGTLPGPVRREIAALGAGFPAYDFRLMEEVVDEELAPLRFSLLLLFSFAGLSLLLASLGIYGILAFSVSRRRRELGIRIAVGASRTAVVRLVIFDGLRLLAIGIATGLAAAYAASFLLSRGIAGLRPLDLPGYAVIIIVFLAAGLLACWLPARGALQTDPARVLAES